MRERWAWILALASGGLLVLIAAGFAAWHNQQRPIPAPLAMPANAAPARPLRVVSTAVLARGQAVYQREHCAACHSLVGVGNPGLPLDGVGAQRDALALRQWIVADPAIAAALSKRIRDRKVVFAELPAADLDALVAYLQSAPVAVP